ncbi:type II secretion system minor pseudopilin GspJ [Thiohalobacter sp.]|uniref:type II secretion system minor pseudopilin GspJ n=1 Tax=Thiohalobacter sp. TaxID=2025948 RepID=UPI00261AFE7C|nr:type II secretion system minor pseudopilin GspJ [Thiohalobacter sp.]
MRRHGGFTLIELLVALAIFAVLALLAYGGLNTVMSTRAAVAEQAEALGRLQLLYRRLERDLTQAVDRPVRDAFGDRRPALLGHLDGNLVELTRAGWRNPAGQPRSELRRVVWRLTDDGGLERAGWWALDRVQGEAPRRERLGEGIERAEVRFLDEADAWHEEWPPRNRPQAPALPRAVELILETEGYGELRWLFRLPDASPASPS